MCIRDSYVYAWPVQQLLVFTGVHQHGVALYDILVLAGTVPFAVASWLVVERPAMRRARRPRGPATRDRGPATRDRGPAAPDRGPAAPDDRVGRVQPT